MDIGKRHRCHLFLSGITYCIFTQGRLPSENSEENVSSSCFNLLLVQNSKRCQELNFLLFCTCSILPAYCNQCLLTLVYHCDNFHIQHTVSSEKESISNISVCSAGFLRCSFLLRENANGCSVGLNSL